MEEEFGTPRRSAGVWRRRVLKGREGGAETGSSKGFPKKAAQHHRLGSVVEEKASTTAPGSGEEIRGLFGRLSYSPEEVVTRKERVREQTRQIAFWLKPTAMQYCWFIMITCL